MLNNAAKGHDLRSSRQLLKVRLLNHHFLIKSAAVQSGSISHSVLVELDFGCVLQEHQQLEQEAKELAEKINSIISRAKHIASNHFDSQRILQETDTYLTL